MEINKRCRDIKEKTILNIVNKKTQRKSGKKSYNIKFVRTHIHTCTILRSPVTKVHLTKQKQQQYKKKKGELVYSFVLWFLESKSG